jgi:hypothetical protein
MYGKKRIVIERKKDKLGRRCIAACGGKGYQRIGWLIECYLEKRYLVTNCNQSRSEFTDNLQEAKKIAHRFAKQSSEWYGFQNEKLFND